MLSFQAGQRVWLYTQPSDMRKSYNELSALVKNTLSDNRLSGNSFVFVDRKRTQMKILYFDQRALLNCSDYSNGIEIKNARYYKRFQLAS